MKKFITFALCSIAFGCVASLAYASDYDETHPPLAFGAFKPVSEVKKVCKCTEGEECTCGENCTCADGVGCGKGAARRAARRAARAGGGEESAIDEATYSVGFEPQQMAIMQPVQAVQQVQTVATADPDVCPCCGMKMNAEQKAFMKAKQAAPVQTVPVQPYTTTYTTAPTFGGYYGAGGACVGGNCAGGNCGTAVGSRFRIFRR